MEAVVPVGYGRHQRTMLRIARARRMSWLLLATVQLEKQPERLLLARALRAPSPHRRLRRANPKPPLFVSGWKFLCVRPFGQSGSLVELRMELAHKLVIKHVTSSWSDHIPVRRRRPPYDRGFGFVDGR